jgi:SAM-dependent methyltransferase
MTDQQYIELLSIQSSNANVSGINSYLTWLYQLIEKSLKGEKFLEIGAGSGLSSKFMHSTQITRTDYLPWNNDLVMGNIDAQNLPFQDVSFDSAFALDAIHHIANPIKALSELCRVVRPGGTIVIVEPYVSYFSFLPYKLFHNEETTWNFKYSSWGDGRRSIASDGEQGVLQSLLLDEPNLDFLKHGHTGKPKVSRQFLSPFSFFATGGLGNPFPTPKKIIDLLISFEDKVPALILRLAGARQILVIEI